MAVDQQAASPSGPWSSRNGPHGQYNGMIFNMIFCLFLAFSVSIQNDKFAHIYHCTLFTLTHPIFSFSLFSLTLACFFLCLHFVTQIRQHLNLQVGKK